MYSAEAPSSQRGETRTNGRTPALNARRFTGSQCSNCQAARRRAEIAWNKTIARKYARIYIERASRLANAVKS